MKKGSVLRLVKALLMVLLAAACLFGCSAGMELPQQKEDHSRSTGLPLVIASNFPLYDFAREIAGEWIEVQLLLPPGAESHTFEPTQQDILRMQQAGLLLYIGGESDAWVQRVLEGMEHAAPDALRLMDCVPALEEALVEHMEQDPAHGHAGEADAHTSHAYDEHIWTSPRNAMRMVEAITAQFCALDEAHALEYREHAEAYIAELALLDQSFSDAVAEGMLHTIVVGDRFPFLYFVKEYGLAYYSAFAGCAEQSEPSAATVAFLIDYVRTAGVPVILHTEHASEAMADTIAEATGAQKRLFHACHTVTRQEMEQGATYIGLMRGNVQTLREALLCL